MASKLKRVSTANEIVRFHPKPTLRIDDKDFPGVKDFKYGETKTFVVTARVKSIKQGDEYGDYDGETEDSKRVRSTLQITSIKEK